MARDRCMILLQMLHFNDNNVQTDDPLIKIRPIIDIPKNSFSQSFYPYKDLCIDAKDLLMLSSAHESKMIESGRINYQTGSSPKLKPESVADYNIKMGSVDRVDDVMVPNAVNSWRKCLKWYKEVFFPFSRHLDV